MTDFYFDHDKAEADMRAAVAAGDGTRYAEILEQVAVARGELHARRAQQAWPAAVGAPQADLAAWPRCSGWQRLGAYLIDWGAYFLLLIVALTIPFIGWLLLLAVIGAAVANQYAMGHTGQSLGKKTLGIYLVSEDTRAPIGGWAGIGRWLLHLLDSLSLCIGWITGLATGQTFADRIMHTIVVSKPRGSHRT